MEKLKKILSPGHKHDEDVMYGDSNTSRTSGEGSHLHSSASNTGRISGEGSHLPSSTSTDPTTVHDKNLTAADISRPSAIPTHLSSTADDAASTASIRSGVVGAPESSKLSNTASAGNVAQRGLPDRTLAHESERSFPLGSNNTSGQSHLGRDAALAGGAGAAGLGALEARQHNEPTSTGNQYRPQSERLSTTDPLSGHQHKGHGHKFDGDPCPPGDEPQVPGYPHHTTGPHSIDLANVLDPHVPGKFPSDSGLEIHSLAASGTTGLNTQQNQQGHREVPVAGATGTAALGAHQHEKSHHEAPFTGTAGYDDQRFDPAAAHSHKPTESQGIGYPAGATEQKHDGNYGRNAAVGTAAGLTGVGAYEASKDHRSGPTETDPASKTVGPHKSNVLNTIDPRVLPEPEKMKDRNTSGPHKSDALNTLDRNVDSTKRDEPTQHHYGRDAAIAGGAGAAGVGAYEYSHTGDRQQDPSNLTTDPYSQTTTGSHRSGVANEVDPRVDSDLSKANQGHHYGRDAAIAGGVGAAGLGGYEATKKDHLGAPQYQQPLATPTGAPQDARIFDQTQQVPDQKQVGAGWAADSKAQHKLEKERAKEAEKAHDKAVKHDKTEAKAAEKAEEKSEKKHGLLGFLHRDKTPKDTAEERELKEEGNFREADLAAHSRHQHELEAAAAAGTVGVAGASFEPSLQEQQQYSDTSSGQRFGTDEKGHHKLHKEPSAKVQRELEERSREQGTYGGTNTGSAVGNDGFVTEPHTGLPMNVGKYGTGQGGTDGSGNITGYHQE